MTGNHGTLWNYTCSNEGLILPLMNEFTWCIELRAFLYLLAMLYCFFGVAIVADIFMCAIETITSKTKCVHVPNPSGGPSEIVHVKVWNDTVANLTLMALGSSAPEIILSSYEIIGNKFEAGNLGPGSVVGAAAFNLLVITAVCVVCTPNGEVRRIKMIKVFTVTSFFSVFAYLWLVVILVVISPNVVEVWEACLTLAFFPIMVITAYVTDKNFFISRISKKTKQTDQQAAAGNNRTASLKSSGGMDKNSVINFLQKLRRDRPISQQDAAYLATAHLLESQPHSRMFYRVGAIRCITGGRKPQIKLPPKLRQTFEDMNNMQEIELQQVTDTIKGPAVIEFTKDSCQVMENIGTMDIEIQRQGRLDEQIVCHCETSDGTAKAIEDYIPWKRDLIFQPHEMVKTVQVEIVDDDQWEPDEVFYVKLSIDQSNSSIASIGSNSVMEITILDDDVPGTIEFRHGVVKVKDTSIVSIPVIRKNGSDGIVTTRWRTLNRTAYSGKDYLGGEGLLIFQHAETQKSIEIKLVEELQPRVDEQFFVVELLDSTAGADIGGNNRVTVILAGENTELSNTLTLVEKLTIANLKALKLASESWTAQLKDALNVNGGDIENATAGDYALHFLTFGWKVLFALIPPTNYCGGWLSFFFALFFIGLLTALVGDMASIFGCLVGLKDSVTAITFVALGTSLPDLFASKAAAQNEQFADSAVGNVNGSNAVNVFLGLGLSWTMAAVYWKLQGLPFKVASGTLAFSVSVYGVCSVICITLVMFRRFSSIFGKGELGGPRTLARATAGFLVCLWVSYLIIASLEAYGYISPF